MWMRTRPPSMRYIAPPGSPLRKRTLPAGLSSSSSSSRKPRAVSSSSEAKSGTERSDSSVIRGRTFSDIKTHLAEIFVDSRDSKQRGDYHDLTTETQRHSLKRFRAQAVSLCLRGESAFALRLGGDLDVLVHDACERFPAARADNALDLAAAVEEDERGDALDAEALRHLGVLVHVELEETHAPRVLLRQLLEGRRKCAARRAPLRPEVQHHRHVRPRHFLLEARVINRRNILAHLFYLLFLTSFSKRRRAVASAQAVCTRTARAFSNRDYKRGSRFRRPSSYTGTPRLQRASEDFQAVFMSTRANDEDYGPDLF